MTTFPDMPVLPDALCRELDAEMFFPVSDLRWTGERRSWRDQGADARYACSRCPEQVACLEYALDHKVTGIWGGTSDLQRKRINEKRKSA